MRSKNGLASRIRPFGCEVRHNGAAGESTNSQSARLTLQRAKPLSRSDWHAFAVVPKPFSPRTPPPSPKNSTQVTGACLTSCPPSAPRAGATPSGSRIAHASTVAQSVTLSTRLFRGHWKPLPGRRNTSINLPLADRVALTCAGSRSAWQAQSGAAGTSPGLEPWSPLGRHSVR